MSVQYTGGYSVHWGNIMSTLGDVQYTGVFSTLGSYHDKCGEGHCENNWIGVETPVYWTSPGVLKISPTLIIVPLHCTHGIPPVYSWYTSSVLMISPTVLNTPCVFMEPPIYCTHPSLLHTSAVLHKHYTGWYIKCKKFRTKNWRQKNFGRSLRDFRMSITFKISYFEDLQNVTV